MDFFEEQDRARRKTLQLILLYGLAVASVCLGVYLISLSIFDLRFPEDGYQRTDDARQFTWWRPDLLAISSTITLSIIAFGAAYRMWTLSRSTSIIPHLMSARKIEHTHPGEKERRYINIVEEMAIASGIPVPDMYILDQEHAINAFASGLGMSDAAITVTRGALDKLNRDQLQGVIGHEFSHIFNGDVLLNIRALGLLHGLLLIHLIGRGLIRLASGNSGDRGGVVFGLLGIMLWLVGSIGVFFARIVQSAVSRQREFLADASSVQFTRNPDGLSGALLRVKDDAMGSQLETHHVSEVAHMLFLNGLKPSALAGKLFSTHPPIDERIYRLQPDRYPKLDSTGTEAAQTVSSDLLPTAGFAATTQQAIEHVGQPTAQEFQVAHNIYAALPAHWLEARKDLLQARTLLLGLLLSSDEEVRAKQLKAIEQTEGSQGVEGSAAVHQEFKEQHSAKKIALIDLSIPTLRQLDPADYDNFRNLLDALIKADGRRDLFEYMLTKIVQRHLDIHFGKRKTHETRLHSLKRLLPEISILTSTLARLGSTNSEQMQEAMQAAREAIQVTPELLIFQPKENCSLTNIDKALNRLSRATYSIRKQVLYAASAAVTADQIVTTRQAELLRAIGDAIGCPIPPFVGKLMFKAQAL